MVERKMKQKKKEKEGRGGVEEAEFARRPASQRSETTAENLGLGKLPPHMVARGVEERKKKEKE